MACGVLLAARMNSRANSAPLTTARSHIEGSLVTTPLDRVLAACRRSQMTGHVDVEAAGKAGRVQLRAGAIARAEIGGWSGPGVLATLRSLRDGRFEVVQRLPDAVDDDGDPGDAPIAAVLRQCEERALTCSLIVTAGLDCARVEVRAGAVARVEVNGFVFDEPRRVVGGGGPAGSAGGPGARPRGDDDALDEVLAWSHARFHVIAPRLELDAEHREATPLPPPPTPMPAPEHDLTPVKELRFETAVTGRFVRPDTSTRTALIAMMIVIAAAIAAYVVFT